MAGIVSRAATLRAAGLLHGPKRSIGCTLIGLLLLLGGCATIKESDTARTGIEQLLISTAVDRALDKIDFAPVRGTKVCLDEKHLDCVDKEYVLVALHHRLLAQGCTLCEKAEDADVLMEISSGGVGTDRQDLFVGVPEIPLAPPSPIAIPKLSLFNRSKAMGTAKLLVVAYDNKSKRPVMNSGYALARSDFKNVSILAAGGIQSGSVERELVAATGERSSTLETPKAFASRDTATTVK
ncbi:MAG TPA: DUF6655 family protein [Pirellulales bacterium]|nr:DUF6655 family protein [Pirellulales bacterium]